MLDMKFDQFDENAELDVALLTVSYIIEKPSMPAHQAVEVRVLNNETGVEERWEVPLLLLQTALHQETQNITEVYMEAQGSGQSRQGIGVDGRHRNIS
jgi:hypothetical protein